MTIIVSQYVITEDTGMHHTEIRSYHNKQSALLVLTWILLFMFGMQEAIRAFAHSQTVPQVLVHVKVIDINRVTYENVLTKGNYCGLMASLMDRLGRPTDPDHDFPECPVLQKKLDNNVTF